MTVRNEWLQAMITITKPVLLHMAEGTLQKAMPLYGSDLAGKERCTYLEALGRTVCGIAPWLELEGLSGEEKTLQEEFRELTRRAIVRAVDPEDPAALNFSEDHQPIVDAAFLGEGILRAPRELWDRFSAEEQAMICRAMEATRTRKPYPSNWLLFSAMIEALLHHAGVFWDPMRVDYAFRQLDQWYLGDGVYSDGAHYAWDYYNSFVIHPMLVDLSNEFIGTSPDWDEMIPAFKKRASRYAAHLERMIMPDGKYPVIGRSSAYRLGVFHGLAQCALLHMLPNGLCEASVRSAMTAALRNMLQYPITDENGWLRIGISGNQPGIGEGYISTGSLYLISFFFLPLGLSGESGFWTAPDEPFTQEKIWNGKDVGADHACN